MVLCSPAEIFCGYAEKDEPSFRALSAHLTPLCQERIISLWHPGCVLGGSESATMIAAHLQSARIILLLVSADLLSEQHERLIAPALERHARGEARVVPILVRPADWTGSALGKIAPLPSDNPIVLWGNADQAFARVAQGLRELVCMWHQLPAALAEAMPHSAEAQTLLFNLGLPTALASGREGFLLWQNVVQQLAAGGQIGQTLTVFDLTARALQCYPESAALRALRNTLPLSAAYGGRTPTPATSLASLQEGAAALRRLAEELHEPAIRQGAAWLVQGKYVAFLAPSGFGASRCLRGVLDRCRTLGNVVTYRLTPLPLAPDLGAYLDDLARQLGRQVPLPAARPGQDPKLSFLERLREGLWALQAKGRHLVLAIDEAERFSDRARLVTLLGLLAQLYEERPDAAPENMGVAVAGGEDLQRLLRGPEYFRGLSVFRAEEIRLSCARSPAGAPPELRGVVEAVGGHPELLLWAAGRGGRVDGRPEEDVPVLRQQVERFRTGSQREQVARLLRGDAAAWADPDQALRWSGWMRDPSEGTGWLGPVLEGLAKRVVGTP